MADHRRRGIQSPGNRGDIPRPECGLRERVVFVQTIGWGDCDPAQIAYTANIPAWGLLAIEEWYRRCIGFDWYGLNFELGIGTPFVSLNFDFKAPVKPGSGLHIAILVSKLGNSSISHRVDGYQDDVLCFSGNTVAAFVNSSSMEPIPIPSNIRHSIQHYISIQDNEPTS